MQAQEYITSQARRQLVADARFIEREEEQIEEEIEEMLGNPTPAR